MNRSIMIDVQKCIGCHTCEVVCSVGHTTEKKGNDFLDKQNFYPRIRVFKLMNSFTVSVCHQCEDAPCAKACSVDALVHGKDSIEAHPERCIGCKACVLACPFGTIEIKNGEVLLRTSALDINPQTAMEIVKCDLCSHREQGPACVEYCPTNALSVVSDAELAQLVKKRRENSIQREFH